MMSLMLLPGKVSDRRLSSNRKQGSSHSGIEGPFLKKRLHLSSIIAENIRYLLEIVLLFVVADVCSGERPMLCLSLGCVDWAGGYGNFSIHKLLWCMLIH